jgi:hypothetical protein
MEHQLNHPSAPNGDRVPSKGTFPGFIPFIHDVHAPARRLPENTEAPSLGATVLLAVAPANRAESLLRLLALLALAILCVSAASTAAAELPALPQISLVPSQSAALGAASWQKGDYTISPLAQYDVTARVLSTHSYDGDRESDVSPIDFALGWGDMADRDMLEQLSVSQRDRWYFVRWRNAPVKAQDVIVNSANTHLIPANDEIRDRLAAVEPGDVVRLRGYLVKVRASDGWTWTSSTARTDTGDGSCEVLWIEGVEVYSDTPIAYAALD